MMSVSCRLEFVVPWARSVVTAALIYEISFLAGVLLATPSDAAEIICLRRAAGASVPWSELAPSGRVPQSDTCRKVLIKGRIEPGDAGKFAQLVRNSHPFLHDVALWSPGGSVEEAVKIGRLIRKGLIFTEAPLNSQKNRYYLDASGLPAERQGWGSLLSVRDCEGANCVCASACFLIWAAGIERTGSVLGVHRPTISSTAFAALPADRAGTLYRQLLSEVGTFLDEMEIPRRYVELMTDTASNDVRWLNLDEANSLETAPSIAEWFASTCGAMSRSEEEARSKIALEMGLRKNVSQRDRALHERLEKKWAEIYRCKIMTISRARDAIRGL